MSGDVGVGNVKPFDEKFWRAGWKFTFIRNPWDRVLSAVAMYNRHAGYEQWTIDAALDVLENLEVSADFADRFDWERAEWPSGFWESKAAVKHNLLPYRFWRLDEMDFIGRFETFAEDWGMICDRVGRRITLPHLNKTSHAHYSRYYDSQLRDRVAAIYRDDIEKYGYKFGR